MIKKVFRLMVVAFALILIIPSVVMAEGIDNPSTYDSGLVYFIVAGISLVGIIVILIMGLKKKNK